MRHATCDMRKSHYEAVSWSQQHCNSKRRLEALINRTIWFPTKLQRGDRCLQACEGSTAPGW